MRHRTPDHWSVPGSFVLFAIAFFVYRIVLGTYGTYHYVRHYFEYLPPSVPRCVRATQQPGISRHSRSTEPRSHNPAGHSALF